MAAKAGEPEVISHLLNRGVFVDTFAKPSKQLLHKSQLPSWNEVDLASHGDQWTALHFAAYFGCETSVAILLKHGAQVNKSTTLCAIRPLHLAIRSHAANFVVMVKILVEHGADVNGPDRYHYTPLHVALWLRGGHAGIVGLLLDKGAQINAKDNSGLTPLHNAVAAQYASIVDVLLSKGAHINAKDYEGRSPLHIAVNNATIMGILLDKGAHINAKDNWGQTPLHRASKIGKTASKSLNLLLDRGAHLDEQDTKGITPLHIAVIRLDKDTVKMLLTRGAAVDIANANDFAALDIAIWVQISSSSEARESAKDIEALVRNFGGRERMQREKERSNSGGFRKSYRKEEK